MESWGEGRSRTGVAVAAHLSAMAGPVIPWILAAVLRRRDAFSAREAARAGNFSAVLAVAAILAFLVWDLVPLVGFVGRLALWAILVMAVYFCVSAAMLTARGQSATYPYQFKVVKTND